MVCGLTAGAGVPAEAAAGLRVRDRLTLTRPDGTRLAFRPDVRVWCGRWEPDVPVPSIHVRVGAGLAPRWELHAVVADVKRRPVVKLPNAFNFDQPKGALLFATDRRNELNSDTEESSGRIRFQRVSCGPRLRIAFRIKARVGSEVSGEPLHVSGSFSAST
ncbi:MAG: hypothetical protein QOC68_3070 [Solirubrobacteraceae bacterium]|jgi:hypothetical protein|nr:hypothetical protein [Solirubrobacteraceae bacterium]